MKKLICLLLVLVCSFAMFSCGDDDEGSDATVETISKIVADSLATTITTKVDYAIPNDEALSGEYTTMIDRTRNSTKFIFSYSRLATIEEGHSDPVKTLAGEIRINGEGNVSMDGDEWVAADATGYLTLELNVDAARFVSYQPYVEF